MRLVLRPHGRGNWAAITIQVSGRRLGPIDFHVGQLVVLGGARWRVSKVLP